MISDDLLFGGSLEKTMQAFAPGDASADRNVPAKLRSARTRILVVDDEPDAREVLCELLEGEGYDVAAESSGRAALTKLHSQEFDLVLSDVGMAEIDGFDLCRQIAETGRGVPVVLITGQGSMKAAVSALRVGAQDFLTKPLDAESLIAALGRALAKPSPRREARVVAPKLALSGVLGQSLAIRAVYELVADLSGSVASVLIQGETGTGKELIARAIHANSRFREGPFVALNCAAMPAGLLESELFGHARGAFTDAGASRTGLLVQANGGTLLLDEIGELPLTMQPKLLRALQERVVRPLGAAKEVPFDCRIIAATNRDLEVEVAEKRFRADLYYRIDVVRITIPPLRERGDDILLLADHFVERFASSSQRHARLSNAAAERLSAYGWPGNVRELENCIERALTLARSDEVTLDDLPEKIRYSSLRDQLEPASPSQASAVSTETATILPLLASERQHILGALKLLEGNKTLAAKLLGMDRRTLYRRLKEYAAAGFS